MYGLIAFVVAGFGMALSCCAQEAAPIGIVRGEMVSWGGTARSGELVFLSSSDKLYECTFDDRTYFERYEHRVPVTETAKGDRIEVLADHKFGSTVCYARIVKVMDLTRAVRPHVTPYRLGQEPLFPRGNLTFAGVVLKVNADELTLRLRNHERKVILLRDDTRFLGEGSQVDWSGMPVQGRVYVRAGRNLYGQVEAYQVVWGGILEPVIDPETVVSFK